MIPDLEISSEGIDISLIKSRLRFSILDRIGQNDSAVCSIAELRKWNPVVELKNDGAIMETANFKEIIRRFLLHKVEFVLIGGLAAVVHGATLVTYDLDVCCPLDEANLARLYNALADAHPVHRTKREIRFIPQPGVTYNNLYLLTDIGVIDCLGNVAGIGDYQNVLQCSEDKESPFGKFRIIDIDSLIRAKSAMNRPQDLLAISQLNHIKLLKKI